MQNSKKRSLDEIIEEDRQSRILVDDMYNNMYEFTCAATKYNNLSLSSETMETLQNENKVTSSSYRDNFTHMIHLNKKLKQCTSEVIMDFDKMINDLKPIHSKVTKLCERQLKKTTRPFVKSVQVTLVSFSKDCPDKYLWESYLRDFYKMFQCNVYFRTIKKNNLRSIVMMLKYSPKLHENYTKNLDEIGIVKYTESLIT